MLARHFLVLLVFILSGSAVAQQPLDLEFKQLVTFQREQNTAVFCVHTALDQESRTVGLMFQEHLPQQGGMLFDFQNNQIIHMWMRNTILPLDMVFIDDDHRVVRIQRNTTPFSLAIVSSTKPARYVLEINAGASREFSVKNADKVTFGFTPCTLNETGNVTKKEH